MFFGSIVKPGSKTPLPTDCGTIFHLSQACLSPTTNTKTYLQITSPTYETVNLCSLKKDQCEHAAFDLFVPAGDAGTFFTVKGDNEVHIAGYFEPDAEPEIDMDDSEIEEEESDTEVANEAKNDELMKEIQKMPGKKFASLMPSTAEKKGQKLAASLNKNAGQSPEESDDSDDEHIDMANVGKILGQTQGTEGDDDDSDAGVNPDDSDVSDSDDDDNEDEIDVEEIAKAIEKARKNARGNAPKKAESTTALGKFCGAKRKPDMPAQNVPAKKMAKKESDSDPSAAGGGSRGGEEEKYQKGLVEYLKAHGKTLISQLGGAVKRPASVKKLGAFVRERDSVFNVHGAFVSLK